MTRLYGLHTNHDAGLAKIEGNNLVYSYELEKFNENRYCFIKNQRHVDLLIPHLEEEDVLAVSGETKGWFYIDKEHIGFDSIGYTSTNQVFGCLPSRIDMPDRSVDILSVHHTSCHVIGSYCASPFAKRGEDAYVSMWDGGVVGLLYYVNHDDMTVDFIGQTTKYNGNVFLHCSSYWGPMKFEGAKTGNFKSFKSELNLSMDRYHPNHLSWRGAPGILMAYQGLGKVVEEIIPILKKYQVDSKSHFPSGWNFEPAYWDLKEYDDADIIATIFHHFGISKMDNVINLVKDESPSRNRTRNMVLTGGCALNIKWNSYLRSTGEFDEVWAPPFPNDSGVALGAATVKMVLDNKSWDFDWDTYQGQPLNLTFSSSYKDKWKKSPCDLHQLAKILWEKDVPVVFLLGNAELGPRALGHRSILASPVSDTMQFRLNKVKNRAMYRPVAPMCMEAYATQYFTPGTPDPYMLFDHMVKSNVREKIPAVIHVDGTARLQTVNAAQEPRLHTLLEHFRRLSGIPMLCNTSANDKGKGFFHSLESALDWGGTKYVWAEGYMYERL